MALKPTETFRRCIVCTFGVVVWIYFLFIFIEVSAFIVNLGHDFHLEKLFCYNIDHNPPATTNVVSQVLINVALLGFFAIPHSLFARPGVKKALGRNEKGTSAYRSIFVL